MRSSESDPLKSWGLNTPPSPFQPTLRVAEPSVGRAKPREVEDEREPSTYALVALAAPSPCVTARWCHVESQRAEAEGPYVAAGEKTRTARLLESAT